MNLYEKIKQENNQLPSLLSQLRPEDYRMTAKSQLCGWSTAWKMKRDWNLLKGSQET